MEPGYLIALCLAGAGTIGLGFGLCALHGERRAKAAELARFLHSGQSSDASPAPVRHRSKPRPTPPMRVRTAAPAAGVIDPSDALVALRSAYAAPVR